MDKSILEKLYNGEISPLDTINVKTEEYKEFTYKMIAEEKHFRSILSISDWERFEEFESIQLLRSSLMNYENFYYGFSLGARMILNIMEEKDLAFEDILKN